MKRIDGVSTHLKRFALMAATMALAVFMVFAMPRSAQAMIKQSRTLTDLQGNHVIYLKGTKGSTVARWDYTFRSKTLTSPKSSNRAVAAVDFSNVVYSFPAPYPLTVIAKKPGRTTITYTYKGKNYKANVTVKRYVKPVKYITVGTSKRTHAFATNATANVAWDDYRGKKFSVTPAAGWKMKAAEFVYEVPVDVDTTKISYKTLRNGATLRNWKRSSKFDPQYIVVLMEQVKTGAQIELTLNFSK